MKTKLIFLILFILSIGISAQNIPNGGFENWDTFGSMNYPANWLFMTSPVCTPTLLPAEQTDDSYLGNWAVKLESHTCIGMPGTNLEMGFKTGALFFKTAHQ